MKNYKLRSYLFALVLFASIGSFAYINSVSVNDCTVKCEAKKPLMGDEEAENKSSSELPDVKLFKKLIEKGKELIPATQIQIINKP